MNNIYDLFNNRKQVINEGFIGGEEYEYPVFESLDESIVALDELIKESVNDEIELRSAFYMEDLVLEAMMYENFNEEEMQEVIEESLKEKAGKLKDGIIKVWNKIKAWIESTAEAIRNHFLSGKKLIDKYGEKAIKNAINTCDVEVKIGWYEGYKAASAKAGALRAKLNNNNMMVSGDKQQILNAVGAKDIKGAAGLVVKCYMKAENKGTRKVKELDAGEVVEYVANATVALDNLRKDRKDMEKTTKEAISKLDKKNENEAKIAENAKFMLNVRSSMISAEMKCIRKISADYRQIIIKALSKGNKEGAGEKQEKGTAEPPRKVAGALTGPTAPKAKKENPGTALAVRKESFDYTSELEFVEETEEIQEESTNWWDD